jgi:hypothetical protein
MRTLPILLLAVALTAPTRADDPPHLAAARKRQQAATAFEAKLAVVQEWRNVVQVQPAPPARRTVAHTSAARLITDGDLYWSELNDPVLSSLGLNRHAMQVAYDGTWLGLRSEFDTPEANQSQISRVSTARRTDDPFRPRWHGLFDPLRWAYRGGLALTEVTATGKEETIGGRVCREYAWPPRVGGGISVTLDGKPPPPPAEPPPVERVWLDTQRDYLPVRYTDRGGRTTDIEYRADDRVGWAPVRWTAVEPYPGDPEATAVVSVTFESFAVREAVPADTFRVRFQPGRRVTVIGDDSRSTAEVGDDGYPLLGEQAEKQEAEKKEPPTLNRSLLVVGGAVAVFAGLVVLVRRLARNRADQPAATE